MLKRLLVTQNELYLSPDNETLLASLNEVNTSFLDMNAPADMSPRSRTNKIIEMEISNEQTLLSLEEAGLPNARNLTTFQFEVYIKKNKDEIDRMKNASK
jgi:hypothetical protein